MNHSRKDMAVESMIKKKEDLADFKLASALTYRKSKWVNSKKINFNVLLIA